MTEAIARAADKEWRQTLAAERAAMLEALERIKPQLERLAVGPAKNIAQPQAEVVRIRRRTLSQQKRAKESAFLFPISESSAKSGRETQSAHSADISSENMNYSAADAEPRGRQRVLPSGDLQSKWASMWHLQQTAANKQHDRRGRAARNRKSARRRSRRLRFLPSSLTNFSPELKKMMEQFPDESGEAEIAPEGELGVSGRAAETAEDTAPVSLEVQETEKSPSPWASATQAHEWLESLHPKSAGGIWLAKHRADHLCRSSGASAFDRALRMGYASRGESCPIKESPQPNLTFFEKLLVSLGLAETPPTPVYLGNPNAQVWVDLHTALYYCSDSDLYGKTPGGKFTTQRDAQMDQFEPAARKDCD